MSVKWCSQEAALLPPEDQEKSAKNGEGGEGKEGLIERIQRRS